MRGPGVLCALCTACPASHRAPSVAARDAGDAEDEGDAPASPWGDEPADCTMADLAPSADEGRYCAGRPEPVGSFPGGRSVYGTDEMMGNVGEIVRAPPVEGREQWRV